MARMQHVPYATSSRVSWRRIAVERRACGILLCAALTVSGMPVRARAEPAPVYGPAAEPDYEQARRLLAKKSWAEAAGILTKLLKTTRGAPELAVDCARALFYLGRRGEALEVLGQAARTERGESRAELSRRARVISRQFMTNATFQLYQDGLSHLSARRYRDAREKLDRALQAEPDNFEVLLRTGQALVLEGKPRQALERLKAAKVVFDGEPELHLWTGRALLLSEDAENAAAELKIARAELPASELAAIWYADALIAIGQRASAMINLDRQSKAYPLQFQVALALVRTRLVLEGKEAGVLLGLRADLQAVQKRLDESIQSGSGPEFESELGVAIHDMAALKEETAALLERVETRLKPQEKTPGA